MLLAHATILTQKRVRSRAERKRVARGPLKGVERPAGSGVWLQGQEHDFPLPPVACGPSGADDSFLAAAGEVDVALAGHHRSCCVGEDYFLCCTVVSLSQSRLYHFKFLVQLKQMYR